ncbi:unnamed protein product [Chilo suppressalis]|uniref:Uncharacterized protein n=1 Tax=Chilo suppressalis TaxID=168631 RepID=A0ABN8L1A2_CHISP|nr:unnamed protein product [Chilo suppressalis]
MFFLNSLLFFLFAGAWKGGLKVRFGMNVIGYGRSYFMSVPRTIAEAKNARWVQQPRPDGPMPELVLYCPSQNDRVLCALFDDTAYVAGLQVALDEAKMTDAPFDWKVQGFTRWTPPPNTQGVVETYQTIQQYFIDEVELAKTPAERITARNADKTIQFNGVWVTGFNGERMRISDRTEDIANTAVSHFTKQACIPLMGRHYYYNMTASTACTADSLFPWFPLVHSGELIGMGFIVFGKLEEKAIIRDYFERPPVTAVKVIVPDGPECLYEMARDPAMITMHSYYINTPWLVDCLLQ